jgi:hypothetical protein
MTQSRDKEKIGYRAPKYSDKSLKLLSKIIAKFFTSQEIIALANECDLSIDES